MRAINLTRTVANPDHMRRDVEYQLLIGDRIAAGKRLFVIQKQRLMAGIAHLGKRPGVAGVMPQARMKSRLSVILPASS